MKMHAPLIIRERDFGIGKRVGSALASLMGSSVFRREGAGDPLEVEVEFWVTAWVMRLL
jgi:hypothetical protein